MSQADTPSKPGFPAMTVAQAHALLTQPGSKLEMDEVVIRGVKTRVWKAAPPSLREVVAIARAFADRTVLVYENDRATYESLYRAIIAFAEELQKRGVKKGDRVASIMRRAAAISAKAHVRAMRFCRPGRIEYELMAEIVHEFRRMNQYGILGRYLPAKPGDIRSTDGQLLGTHQGLMYYTLGQRQGLGIGGRRDADTLPWYVAGKDLERNVLIVVQGHEHPDLLQDRLLATNLHWIGGDKHPRSDFDCTAKTRYRQADQRCHVRVLADGNCDVSFERPQRAMTPGQYVVFYRDAECLGGGVIQEVGRTTAPAAKRLRA